MEQTTITNKNQLYNSHNGRIIEIENKLVVAKGQDKEGGDEGVDVKDSHKKVFCNGTVLCIDCSGGYINLYTWDQIAWKHTHVCCVVCVVCVCVLLKPCEF